MNIKLELDGMIAGELEIGDVFTLTDNPGAVLMRTMPSSEVSSPSSFRSGSKTEVRCVNLGNGLEQRVGVKAMVTRLKPSSTVVFVHDVEEK